MRPFCAALLGALFLTLPALAGPLDDPARVRLTQACERPAPGGCIIHISIEGTITPDTPILLLAVLNEETRRINAPVVPYVNIASPGGDVNAAMQIGGRDLHGIGPEQ